MRYKNEVPDVAESGIVVGKRPRHRGETIDHVKHCMWHLDYTLRDASLGGILLVAEPLPDAIENLRDALNELEAHIRD